MLDDADKNDIRIMIEESIGNWDLNRRTRARESQVQREAENPMVTKLYLISLGGHHIAFPDERGRAIFTQSIYARVTKRDDDHFFHSGKVEVVAYGDGQRLEKPLTMLLTGLSVVGLVEVEESILAGKNSASPAA